MAASGAGPHRESIPDLKIEAVVSLNVSFQAEAAREWWFEHPRTGCYLEEIGARLAVTIYFTKRLKNWASARVRFRCRRRGRALQRHRHPGGGHAPLSGLGANRAHEDEQGC